MSENCTYANPFGLPLFISLINLTSSTGPAFWNRSLRLFSFDSEVKFDTYTVRWFASSLSSGGFDTYTRIRCPLSSWLLSYKACSAISLLSTSMNAIPLLSPYSSLINLIPRTGIDTSSNNDWMFCSSTVSDMLRTNKVTFYFLLMFLSSVFVVSAS